MTKDKIINHLISMLPISLEDSLSINESILNDANWASTNSEYDKQCRRKLVDENKILNQIIKSIKK